MSSALLSSAAVRQLWAPWRMEYVGDRTPSEGCVLCAIDAGETDQERHVVERTAQTFTVLNLHPYSSGHLLVVPHRHVPDLVALSPAEGAGMFAALQRAMRALQAALGPDGFNLGVNHGRVAGAGITDHVHAHVVPRWDGDTNFMPVLADVKVLPEHLDRTAERLRAAYAGLGPDPSGP
ncbi:MAG TPA: HIT domain-containing protein [Candidatus Dormibacteraeota bacterium]|nr:HIT domain-containing protein [Candidatus Dormibacteraeota bacterium]